MIIKQTHRALNLEKLLQDESASETTSSNSSGNTPSEASGNGHGLLITSLFLSFIGFFGLMASARQLDSEKAPEPPGFKRWKGPVITGEVSNAYEKRLVGQSFEIVEPCVYSCMMEKNVPEHYLAVKAPDGRKIKIKMVTDDSSNKQLYSYANQKAKSVSIPTEADGKRVEYATSNGQEWLIDKTMSLAFQSECKGTTEPMAGYPLSSKGCVHSLARVEIQTNSINPIPFTTDVWKALIYDHLQKLPQGVCWGIADHFENYIPVKGEHPWDERGALVAVYPSVCVPIEDPVLLDKNRPYSHMLILAKDPDTAYWNETLLPALKFGKSLEIRNTIIDHYRHFVFVADPKHQIEILGLPPASSIPADFNKGLKPKTIQQLKAELQNVEGVTDTEIHRLQTYEFLNEWQSQDPAGALDKFGLNAKSRKSLGEIAEKIGFGAK